MYNVQLFLAHMSYGVHLQQCENDTTKNCVAASCWYFIRHTQSMCYQDLRLTFQGENCCIIQKAKRPSCKIILTEKRHLMYKMTLGRE